MAAHDPAAHDPAAAPLPRASHRHCAWSAHTTGPARDCSFEGAGCFVLLVLTRARTRRAARANADMGWSCALLQMALRFPVGKTLAAVSAP